MVYGELGRYPLYIDSAVSTVRFWFKLQSLFLVRLPKQAYQMQINTSCRYADNQCQTHNWVTGVKHCLDTFGFSVVWLNGGVGNEKCVFAWFQTAYDRLI